MKVIRIAIIAVAVAGLAGCRSSRHAQKPATITDGQENHRVENPAKAKRNTSVNALQAKMDVTLSRGKKSVHCTGTYRVKRGELVQLNLVYSMLFVSVNVGTLELTPDYILLVDRVGRRYCKVGYDEVPQLRSYGLTFADIEPLFWGDKGDMKGKAMSCVFSDWAKLSEGRFPSKINLTLDMKGKAVKAAIVLNDMKERADGTTYTEVSKKYQKVGLDVVMNAIMSAAG